LILCGHNKFCSTLEYVQFKIGGMTAPFTPTSTRQATVSDGCVVLNLLLPLQTRRQLTLPMQRQIWYG